MTGLNLQPEDVIKRRLGMAKRICAVLILACMVSATGACTIPITRARKGLPVTPLAYPERTPVYESGEWIIARASMHNHTTFSDGKRSMEGLVQLARNQGMAVLAITDHHKLGRTIGPITARDNSITEREGGYKDYFEHLCKVRDETHDVIVIPGVEYTGWSWGEGKFPNMTVWGMSHHFVVYGINDYRVWEQAPYQSRVPMIKYNDPDLELEPLIELVGFFRDAGGMVFWAHPDWYSEASYGPIKLKDHPCGRLVNQLKDINGFAAVPEGFFEAAQPGTAWDHALLEYILGERDSPVWAIGDADYHGEPHTLANGTTMLYLHELTREQVYQAMEKGRMVVHMGDPFQDVFVKEFRVSVSRTVGDEIMLGEKVKLDASPCIGFALNSPVSPIRVRLIRNGMVIHETDESKFVYIDNEAFERGLPAYYRVEIKGERRGKAEPWPWSSYLFTNPVFVEF
jgi:hypothetical protein